MGINWNFIRSIKFKKTHLWVTCIWYVRYTAFLLHATLANGFFICVLNRRLGTGCKNDCKYLRSIMLHFKTIRFFLWWFIIIWRQQAFQKNHIAEICSAFVATFIQCSSINQQRCNVQFWLTSPDESLFWKLYLNI